ncbi:hypothetical protein E3E36_06280 [Thermococcus sp. M36]|uniref:hypothetical protein n=1 Tax=Thermococcus sp. M36 TaxID=1638261 RepID=UPI001438B561|nr:hypothetical protein [Thermococcus sp. M36]NJE05755.1 hypothetical protein [Thermococcus sp. M36]
MRNAVKVVFILLLISFFIGGSLLYLWKDSDGNSSSFTGSLNITRVWDGQGDLVGIGDGKLVLLSRSGHLEILRLENWEPVYSAEDVEDAGLFSGVLAFRKGGSLYYTGLDTIEPHRLEAPIENPSLGFRLGNLTFLITRNPAIIHSGVRVPGNITIHVCGGTCGAFLFEDGEGRPFILRTEEGFVIGVASMEPFYHGKVVFLSLSGEPVAERTFSVGVRAVGTGNGTVFMSTGGVERSGTAIWSGKIHALDERGRLLWNASIENYTTCGYAPSGAFLLADGNIYTVDYRGLVHVFNKRGEHLRTIETPASETLQCGDLIKNVVSDGDDSMLAWAYFDVSSAMEERSGLCVYTIWGAVACRTLTLRPNAIAVRGNYVILSLSSAEGKEKVEVFQVGGIS